MYVFHVPSSICSGGGGVVRGGARHAVELCVEFVSRARDFFLGAVLLLVQLLLLLGVVELDHELVGLLVRSALFGFVEGDVEVVVAVVVVSAVAVAGGVRRDGRRFLGRRRRFLGRRFLGRDDLGRRHRHFVVVIAVELVVEPLVVVGHGARPSQRGCVEDRSCGRPLPAGLLRREYCD